ncbi:MAG: YhgE/Pip family protein [Propionicimonas sp.]
MSATTSRPEPAAATPTTTDAPAVRASGLQLDGRRGRIYGPVDLDIAPGSLTLVTGRAGSGRTSLLLTLVGRLKPSRGSDLTVLGRRLPARAPYVQRRTAAVGVHGLDDLDEEVTVGAALREREAWLAPWFRIVRTPDDDRVAGVCAPVFGDDPVPRARQLVHELDEAANLRFRLALALLGAPELVVVDDIDALRDTDSRRRVGASLQALAASGVTVIASASSAADLAHLSSGTPAHHVPLPRLTGTEPSPPHHHTPCTEEEAMFAWTSHGTELKRFARQPITRAAIAVMLLIPLLYGAMYVWAFWDPTTRMDELPVALVNADVAARDDDGTLQHYGQDVVDELLDDGSVGWRVVDADAAAAGVNAGTYYFAVTIPADFTSDILSLGEDDPTAARIMVSYDDSNSFLASTLGRTAMTEVRDAVVKKVSKQAVNTLLVGVGDARDGFAKASDGAFTLATGLADAADGADTLNVGAQQLADGAAQLAAGTDDLSTGAKTLHSKLGDYVAGVTAAAEGAERLNAGAAHLSALQQGLATAADPTTGAPALAAGVDTLASGVTTLANGATSYAEGATQFADGAANWTAGADQWLAGASAATAPDGQLATGTKKLASGASDLADATASGSTLGQGAAAVTKGAGDLADGLDSVDGLLDKAQEALADGDTTSAAAYLSAARKATSAAHGGAKDLATGAAQVQGGIASVHSGATELASGASAVQAGWAGVHAVLASDGSLGVGLTKLDAAQEQLATGASGLTTGAAQLADPATLAEVAQLQSGADTLATGLTTMSAAASDSTTGIPALQSGLAQLVAGFDAADPEQGLVSGAKALRSGAGTLADGLASADSGATKLSTGSGEIAANTPTLASGLDKAENGAGRLGVKLADAADQIPSDGTSLRHDRAKAVSTPVTLSSSHVHEAASWGEGFAPFFISLALWVGALITWLLLRPLQTRALMTSVNGFRMAWGSLNSALLLALGQVTIMLVGDALRDRPRPDQRAGHVRDGDADRGGVLRPPAVLPGHARLGRGQGGDHRAADGAAGVRGRHLPDPDHAVVPAGDQPVHADDLRGERVARGDHRRHRDPVLDERRRAGGYLRGVAGRHLDRVRPQADVDDVAAAPGAEHLGGGRGGHAGEARRTRRAAHGHARGDHGRGHGAVRRTRRDVHVDRRHRRVRGDREGVDLLQLRLQGRAGRGDHGPQP